MGTINSVTRKFRFEAAHRLVGHSGKCRFLHGHSYLAEVTIVQNSENTDNSQFRGIAENGMVIDFGIVKELVDEFIADYWDHNTILGLDDPILNLPENQVKMIIGRNPYVLQCGPPTAEMMAIELKEIINTKLNNRFPGKFRIWGIKVQETENCFVLSVN